MSSWPCSGPMMQAVLGDNISWNWCLSALCVARGPCLVHRNTEPLSVQHSLESCLSGKERQQKAVWGATAPVAQTGPWRCGTTAWDPACSDIVFCLIVERLLPVFCLVKSLCSLSSLLWRTKIWKILPPRTRPPVVSVWQFEKIAQSEKDNFVLRKSSPHPQWVF